MRLMPRVALVLGLLAITLPRTDVAAMPAAPSGPGKTFQAPGATIWYEVRGSASGRPMIMVNGGPGFDHNYVLCSNAWDAIAKKRRVVFYDQRGNGRSGALTKEQTTLGRGGVQVVRITRIGDAFLLTQLEGDKPATVNGAAPPPEGIHLQPGDVIDLVDTRVDFLGWP